MADTQKFHRFMAQFAPMLVQEQRREKEVLRWLEKTLQEHASWEATQERLGESATLRNVIEQLTSKEPFKERVLPEEQLLSWINKVFPGLAQKAGAVIPEEVTTGKNIEEAANSLAAMSALVQAGEDIPEELYKTAAKFFGEKPVQDYLMEVTGQKMEVGRIGMRREELEHEKALLPIRKGELEVRRVEAGLAKGEMTAKEARRLLEDLAKERRDYQTKRTDLDEEEFNAVIAEIREKESSLIKKFNLELNQDYKMILKELKTRGFKKEDLEQNEQLISVLIDQGYDIELIKKHFQ